MLEMLRGAVRPVVTIIVTLAQIGFIVGGFPGEDFGASQEFMPITVMVLGWWFLERATRRAGQ